MTSQKDLFLVVPLGLVLTAFLFPYWTIWFNAPMYGKTWFEISVYPTGAVTGPIFEVNIMNHYVGIGKLEPEKMIELKLLPAVWVTIAVLVSVAWLWRETRKGLLLWCLALVILVAVPVYHWIFLDKYLNTRDPDAPVKAGYVPPLIIGADKVANIYRVAYLNLGYYLPVAALILTAPWISRKIDHFLDRIGKRRLCTYFS